MFQKIGIIIALFGVLSVFFWVLVGERMDVPVPERMGASLEKVRVVHSQGAAVKWRLEAEQADLSEDMKTVALRHLVLKIIGDRPVDVTSQEGVYSFSSEDMDLWDSVLVKTDDWVLNTERLAWSSKNSRLTTSSPVRIEGRRFLITGTGLMADTAAEMFRVSQVTCQLR